MDQDQTKTSDEGWFGVQQTTADDAADDSEGRREFLEILNTMKHLFIT